MQKRAIVFLLVGLLLTTVSAEWKSLGDVRSAEALQVKVLKNTSDETTLEVTVPGYHQKVVEIKGKRFLVLHMPGAHYLRKKGFPLLPKLAKLVKLGNRKVELKVLEREEVEVPIEAPILPSKGHFTRNIDPATVPFKMGAVYKKDVFWVPAKKQISIGKIFKFRDVYGVRVQVLPVSVNHVQMKMKVIKRLVVSIVATGPQMSVSSSRTAISADFAKLYASAFINYSAPMQSRSSHQTITKKLHVIYPSSYKSAISAWVSHKQNTMGFQVTEVTLASIGGSASDIKDYLKQQYQAGNLEYVVLIGDSDVMPTNRGSHESAHSDRLYVEFTGDLTQEAFISRASGTTDQVQAQLAKVIAYETEAFMDADFSKNAILVGSKQGSPTDQTRLGWIINGGGQTSGNEAYKIGNGGLKGCGYNGITDIYNNGGSSSDKAKISAVLNGNGASVICYIGHGSKTSWASSGFSNTEINNLANQNKANYPVIWSVACVNGAFAESYPKSCFAETWLQKANAGAVAMEASSTNEAWVPPCVKQAGTINAFLNGIKEDKAYTFGYLEQQGMIAATAAYGTSTNKNSAHQLFEQCNLFGDCSMFVKFPGYSRSAK